MLLLFFTRLKNELLILEVVVVSDFNHPYQSKNRYLFFK